MPGASETSLSASSSRAVVLKNVVCAYGSAAICRRIRIGSALACRIRAEAPRTTKVGPGICEEHAASRLLEAKTGDF